MASLFLYEKRHPIGRLTKLNNKDLIGVLEDEPSSSASELATELGLLYNCVNSHPPL
ncbi:hypothetical protein KIN20_001933 [Parelaphostrongylus tenuis]|uniref:Uncharacterized protein n=1 Tax=Parelaphostrongylus tenuis TaxID=148309 RepID=A0AAD5LWZ2_PARTN|nr:hypothetical protein KIN20_001933 [Parelaphostrongylus tenuis]